MKMKLLVVGILIMLLFGENVIAKQVLYVGSTGDYRPLTWYDANNKMFSGKAIDLIQDFANDNNYQIKWVKTSWSNLSIDLSSGKFQLAVGGISANKSRAKQFLFSDPVRIFGKTALVRCGEQKKYASWDKIDHLGVRVIENRGGTNETFALSRIKHATLLIVPNNHLPFYYLKKTRADLMFTDSIEANYIESKNSGLCAVDPKLLYTRGVKVFLFKKNERVLQEQFNTWLSKKSVALIN